MEFSKLDKVSYSAHCQEVYIFSLFCNKVVKTTLNKATKTVIHPNKNIDKATIVICTYSEIVYMTEGISGKILLVYCMFLVLLFLVYISNYTFPYCLKISHSLIVKFLNIFSIFYKCGTTHVYGKHSSKYFLSSLHR